MNWFRSLQKALTMAPATEMAGAPEPRFNFTPDAQQVLALARQEAGQLNHNFVGTEHLLLGLVQLGHGMAVTVLRSLGLAPEAIRLEIEQAVGRGPDQKWSGVIPYTPRVKKVLALAAKEARALNHSCVGTEHILLGLLLEGDGVAPRVLKNLGVDTERTRQEILRQLNPNGPGGDKDLKPMKDAQSAEVPKFQLGAIDTTKRYDVYCSERNQQVMVYRNALFKGRRKLLSTRDYDFGTEFVELEQSNGHTVYLSLHSLLRFCEHGAEMVGEQVPPP